jgi:putative transposase
MRTHHDLTKIGITTRAATTLTSVVRWTAARSKTHSSAPWPSTETLKKVPANKLTATERHSMLTLLNCDRFVDQAPLEVYAELLDEGTYLCSVSTMYRVLRENTQVAERRRLARHPARACPELVATAPRQVYSCYAALVVMPTVLLDAWCGAVAGADRSA